MKRLLPVVLLALLSGPLRADILPGYAGLANSKALAVIPGNPDVVGVAHGQANDLLAAQRALKTCEANRTPAHQPACELVDLNGERITSGADIRARVPDDPHPLLLWRIAGRQSTIYLAGSVHILKASLYPLPVQYEQAFDRASRLVVEVNVAAQDPAELVRKTLSYASLPQGSQIREVLRADLFTRLEERLASYGVPLSQMAGFKPAYLMNQLVLLRLMTLGYTGEYGIEQYFLRKAEGREILELETIDEQLALLFDQPMDLQQQLLEDTLEQEAGIEPLVAGMVVAWLSGDDAGFMEMFEAQSGDSELSRRFTEQLLDQRNHGMAARIRDYLEDEGVYFVLVGAAHLIGENGIVELLRAQGIEAERINSTTLLN